MDCKRSLPLLFPEKLNEMKSPVTSLGDCHFDAIPGHKAAFFREIWEKHGLGLRSTMAEQGWFLYHANSEFDNSDDWVISYNDVAQFLGVPKPTMHSMIQRWEILHSKSMQNVRGRPSLLQQIHIDEIKEHISACEKKHKPLTQQKLLIWINEKFDLKTSVQWMKINLLQGNGIYCVDAEPLEGTRIEVKEEDLKTNAAEMSEKISKADPRFIFNADETSIDSTRETKKRKYFHSKIVQQHISPTELHHILPFLLLLA